MNARAENRVDLAVPSYLHEHVVPTLAKQLSSNVRAWVVPPTAVNAWVTEDRLDAALTVGFTVSAPSWWSSALVATLRSSLFASPAVGRALGAEPSLGDVLAKPFVGAVYPGPNGDAALGNDRCPVPRSARVVGHEAESMRAACAIAAESDQLVYGPEIAAAPFVAEGRLAEIVIAGWPRFDAVHFAFDPSAFEGITDVAAVVQSGLARRGFDSDVVTTVDVIAITSRMTAR